MKEYNVVSLFSGVGGIDLGFLLAENPNKKFNIIFANEIDEYASTTYKNNFKNPFFNGDIKDFLFPEKIKSSSQKENINEKRKKLFQSKVDVLVAGFPCQSFSIAGKRGGFKDERGNLFLSIIEFCIQLEKNNNKPELLFLENVKNLKTHDHGKTYKIIKEKLEAIGYFIKEKVLNTKDYTRIPQNRERIFIMGFLKKEDFDNFSFENIVLNPSKKEDIVTVLDSNINFSENKEFYYTKEKYPLYFNDEKINLDKEITESEQFYQLRRGMYVRKNKSNVCPTLTANMGTGGHNVPLIKVKDGIRKITPKEAFSLQGFPVGKDFVLPTTHQGRKMANSHLYKQAGNSVSVPLVKLLAEEILRVFN